MLILVNYSSSTADNLNIKDNENVRVESLRGSIKWKALITDWVDPRVVHVYYGSNDSNSNVLTDHRVFDPITGSTGLKSLFYRITPSNQ